MSAPRRDFDISWVQEAMKQAPAEPRGGSDAPSVEDSVLAVLERSPSRSRFVVDIAREANTSFREAAQSVLELVSRGTVEIVTRSPNEDHEVRLAGRAKRPARKTKS